MNNNEHEMNIKLKITRTQEDFQEIKVIAINHAITEEDFSKLIKSLVGDKGEFLIVDTDLAGYKLDEVFYNFNDLWFIINFIQEYGDKGVAFLELVGEDPDVLEQIEESFVAKTASFDDYFKKELDDWIGYEYHNVEDSNIFDFLKPDYETFKQAKLTFNEYFYKVIKGTCYIFTGDKL